MKTLKQLFHECFGDATHDSELILVRAWLTQKRQELEWMTDSETAMAKVSFIDELLEELKQ